MNTNIEASLVFSIPLANEGFGFGQLVVRQRSIFYMVAYDVQSEKPHVDDDALRRAKPVLMGNFFDVLISIGRWRPVRHFSPPVVPYPCFKVRIGNALYIESWDQRRRREGTAIELAQLQFRADYAPIILENALNAYFGLRAWETAFEPLRAEAVSAVSELC
jgi:hypothetical protein